MLKITISVPTSKMSSVSINKAKRRVFIKIWGYFDISKPHGDTSYKNRADLMISIAGNAVAQKHSPNISQRCFTHPPDVQPLHLSVESKRGHMQNLSMHRHCFFFWMLFWKAPKASKEPESFCGCQSIPSRLDAFAGQCRMSCRCCSGGNRIKESGQRPTSVTIIPLFLAETLYWSRTSLVRPEVSVQRPFAMSWLLQLNDYILNGLRPVGLTFESV